MKRTSGNPKISLQEAEIHYQQSSENYSIDSTESHMAYYRDKHPSHYKVLLENV
jgi:hypothetical protein|tara:strand:+ start:2055 stop:2216 length:162 start_codon:yes stop_codon:yes gene_type:complete